MTDRELMQQALEALEQVAEYFNADSTEAKTITALRERLAQPDPSEYWHSEFLKYNTTSEQPAQQQELVATWENKYGMKEWQVHALRAGWSPTPPHRKPLTDEEIWNLASNCLDSVAGRLQFARAIEAAHGIKENT